MPIYGRSSADSYVHPPCSSSPSSLVQHVRTCLPVSLHRWRVRRSFQRLGPCALRELLNVRMLLVLARNTMGLADDYGWWRGQVRIGANVRRLEHSLKSTIELEREQTREPAMVHWRPTASTSASWRIVPDESTNRCRDQIYDLRAIKPSVVFYQCRIRSKTLTFRPVTSAILDHTVQSSKLGRQSTPRRAIVLAITHRLESILDIE